MNKITLLIHPFYFIKQNFYYKQERGFNPPGGFVHIEERSSFSDSEDEKNNLDFIYI